MEWFSLETARWFSLFSLLSILAGAGYWIEKGQYKRLVTTLFYAAIAFGGIMLMASFVARIVDQPAHVIRALTMTGVIITVVFGVTLGVVYRGYAKAEQRKILARDI